MLKRNRRLKRLNNSVSANRRKRMSVNKKNRIIWRNRVFMKLQAA